MTLPQDMKAHNRKVIEDFRTRGGAPEGRPLLLLTTIGARSGRERTVPLGYVRDGDRLLVVGSAGGSSRHPAWYHNVLAHPMVRVEVGVETFAAVAVPARGAERDRLFDKVLRVAPGYGRYQAGVARRLPVVALERTYTADGTDPATNLADKLLQVHGWLRDQLRRVHVEAEEYFAAPAGAADSGSTPPVGLSLQIRQHCLAFCQSLTFHHGGEDMHVLPALERQHPHLGEAIRRLRVEHRTVDRIRGELETLLADIANTDRRRFHAQLVRMSRELEAHLDFEERSLIPALTVIPVHPERAGSTGHDPQPKRDPGNPSR